MTTRPQLLIEDWLPVEALGIESRRERAAASALPPLNFLHIWWARRPLVASAGVILASLLPPWADDLAERFPQHRRVFGEANQYAAWFLRLCGILGDPVAARRRIDDANERGERLVDGGYGYRQAFRNRPDAADLEPLHDLLEATWGHVPVVLDPTAGGGSIPFESVRYGLTTYANDLNPVASYCMRAGIDVPLQWGPSILPDIERYGRELCERIGARLSTSFELDDSQQAVLAYVFARSVRCPRTGKPTPLVSSWQLSRGASAAAVRMVTERDGEPLDEPEFEVVTGDAIDFDPDNGTVRQGDGISPWDGLVIDGEYIKAEAQAGRMGSILYAVAVRSDGNRGFRAPTSADHRSIQRAAHALDEQMGRWIAEDVIPSEPIDEVSNYDRGHRMYGMFYWREMFSERQLLAHGTFVEEFRRLASEVTAELGQERGEAVLSILGAMQGTSLNYNALSSSWNVGRGGIRSVFDKHNFAFKWTYAEYDAARALYPWCLGQVLDAYQKLAQLLYGDDGQLVPLRRPGELRITSSPAGDLAELPDGSVDLICMDPPYYDNVMYAELSDFFYVWEKRTVGLVHRDLYAAEVADKDAEAVANPARFAAAGRRKKDLANADYEAKMTAIFAEAHRILAPTGVLTVMFTHKRAEAWDTLGMALMEGGFTIETSWPVNTEFEHSLHQSKKNAAASTIMLVCRKRDSGRRESTYFENLEGEVRTAARLAAEQFEAAGIAGVDLMLASYGPALSVVSSAWPVYSSEADPTTGRSRVLRPEEALDVARAEVVRLRKQRLLGRSVALDALTDFTLLAWETFKAPEFPFDEARRLALAVGGLDTDDLVRAKLIARSAGTVRLLAPRERLRRGGDGQLAGVHLDASSFPHAIDAVHTAMYILDEDGADTCRTMVQRAGLLEDARFLATAQGLLNAVPRDKTKGEFILPEARSLDRLRLLILPDLEAPPEPVVHEVEQLTFSGA